MSILNFPETLEVQVLETGGKVNLGGFQPSSPMELSHIAVLIYIQGSTSGLETLKLDVSSDVSGNRVLFSSSNSVVSEITNLGPNWLGWLRFDFNRQGWPKDVNRYLTLTSTNYTRNGDIYYISAVKDYPLPIYSEGASSFTDASYAATLFGFEEE